MKSILVIGLGSPFGADTLGWQAIDKIQGDFNQSIDFVTLDRPGTSLLNYFKNYKLVILVDAIRGGVSGRVRRLEWQEIVSNQYRFSSHHIGVAETIALGRELSLLPNGLVLFGVETGESGNSAGFSEDVLNELRDAVIADICGPKTKCSAALNSSARLYQD